MQCKDMICFGVLVTITLGFVNSSDFELEIATTKSLEDWEIKEDEVNRFTLTEGTSTRLKCFDNHEETNSTNISWTYLRCKLSECSGSGRGSPICGTVCKPWLKLDKIKMSQAGLYSCYTTTSPSMPGYTIEAHHLRSYHVTVLKGEIISEPVFVESPKTIVKVMSMTRLLLSCRISSLVPAIVRWFKQVPETMIKPLTTNPTYIVYQNKTYQPLDWYPFERKGNEYSGKLLINKTRTSDAGNYVCCIVTSQYGIQLREARVIVTPYISKPRNREEEIMYEWSQAEKIWTAAALAVVVMVSCGWVAACCCIRSSSGQRPTRTRRNKQRGQPPTAATDTSDYEQV